MTSLKNTTVFLFFAVLFLLSFKTGDLERVTAFNTHEENTSKVYALKIPTSIHFSGEEVPIDQPDIRERLDKEMLVNTYWQSNMMLLIKRTNKYFPTIEKILEEEGVPDDFKYLAVIESALENVRSPKGAKGFWQLMPGTAKEYGLEVNDNVDERYHLEKSTRIACVYLKKAKERLGSWTLAAASYNRGMYGTDRLLDKQLAESYYDLLLNSETSRYVFRIIAVKEIMSNPQQYGFIFEESDLYLPIPERKIGLDTAITNLAQFAKEQNINYKVLKIHNPWLIENHLNNKSRKYYEIAIPEEGYY
ncbi:MAG TPA: murein transglycosylase [Flavobacteriaceae bacterium]|jgi:membrane-bound lytic murein transglycosylase D|nr:murein transglycosylase [Flavobacteriaceae bacterium]